MKYNSRLRKKFNTVHLLCTKAKKTPSIAKHNMRLTAAVCIFFFLLSFLFFVKLLFQRSRIKLHTYLLSNLAQQTLEEQQLMNRTS